MIQADRQPVVLERTGLGDQRMLHGLRGDQGQVTGCCIVASIHLVKARRVGEVSGQGSQLSRPFVHPLHKEDLGSSRIRLAFRVHSTEGSAVVLGDHTGDIIGRGNQEGRQAVCAPELIACLEAFDAD